MRGNSKRQSRILEMFPDGTYVDSYDNFLGNIKHHRRNIFLISEDMIPTKNMSDIASLLDSCTYDVLWLNKIRDECEYHYKIDDDLRKSRRPGSIQAVYISEDVVKLICKSDIKNYDELVIFLNSMTYVKNTAVTANNYFIMDMNAVTCIQDYEKFIECDYPYKKDKMYTTSYKVAVFLIFLLIIIIMTVYLVITFRS